jgi:hypothetical protein
MRQLHDHEINEFNVDHVQVFAVDDPDNKTGGGASHQYAVETSAHEGHPGSVTRIQFQHGPVKEAGVNGLTNEALIAIVQDRLRSFQKGPFSCRENALALTKLDEAMMWMHKRTFDRVRRGVEGEHKV